MADSADSTRAPDAKASSPRPEIRDYTKCTEAEWDALMVQFNELLAVQRAGSEVNLDARDELITNMILMVPPRPTRASEARDRLITGIRKVLGPFTDDGQAL